MNGQILLSFRNRISGSGRLYLLVFAMMFVVVQGWASVFQSGSSVTGTVVDSNNEPLIGATVRILGTSTGTITDFDGKFIINVTKENPVIEVSYIGYETKKVRYRGQKTLLVVLSEEQTVLEEVVVVGYGTQKKESVVGAISQVGSKALVDAGSPNITNAIAGKLSGVMTMQTSSKPGASDAEIVIRGVSSWNGNQPLVLVDGIERDFGDIDPNEVETISVLKDASATAVFGARGANGVIIVTTKEGQVGDPKFNITASHGISWATRVPEHVDAVTTLNAYNDKLMNGQQFDKLVDPSRIQKYATASTPLEKILYPDNDWFDLLTNKFAHVTNANANLRGGTDFLTYFCSMGFTQETSLFNAYVGENKYHDTNYDYKRFNYRTNLNFNLTRTSKLQLKVGGDVSINNKPTEESWNDVFSASGVAYPAYYPAWMLEEFPDTYYPDASGIRLVDIDAATYLPRVRNNPYNIFNSGKFTRTNAMKLFTDLIYDQKLDFITKGLSLQGKVSLSTNYNHTSLTCGYNQMQWIFHPDRVGTDRNPWERSDEGDMYWTENPINMSVGSLGSFKYDLHYEASLRYNRNFGQHNVTALALMNRDIQNANTEYPYLYESWVGRATYNFANRYFIEGNVGYTGSEKFSPENRFGFFPAGAIGWMISEEPFFKEAFPWVSKFKVRYSDGLVGSDDASERWLYISDYTKSGNITEDRGANVLAQWEEARKQDFGVEFGFFDNKLTFGIDLFKELRTKMLLSPKYNFLVGQNFKDLNLGSIKKHGYEIEIAYRNRTEFGLNYNIRGMLSFSENRIISKDDFPYAPDYQKSAGKAFGSQASGQIAVDGEYFNSVDELHIYPVPATNKPVYLPPLGSYKLVDYNGDGYIGKEDVFSIEGSNYAPYVFSLSGGLSYKNFEISMVWTGALGKYVEYNASYFTEFPGGEVSIKENMVDYWTPDNKDAAHNAMGGQDALSFFAGGNQQTGSNLRILDHSWMRANYIKLKDLNISYQMNSRLMKKLLGVNKIKFFFVGSNLLMFTELPMGDPECKVYSTGNYPTMASARLGFNVNF